MTLDNYSGKKILIVVSSDAPGCGTAVKVARSPRSATIQQQWGFFSYLSFLSRRSWFSCQAFKKLVLSFILYLF